ncbi:MAG: hypothetical protein KIS66_15370 [Fimbriimonadaceae bacterium]|nr:hypothetical protein [Fimbriimonadaceae bacterium]
MTSRERLTVALRGGEVDRRPVVSFAVGAADAYVVSPGSLRSVVRRQDEAILAEVPNPFGLAKAEGVDLNAVLAADPAAGSALLDRYATRVKATIGDSFSRGADGLFYRLAGACPAESSPMQYGGHHLEIDRELLGGLEGAACNIVYVEGEEPYLEFVSDLPAHALGWDVERSAAVPSEIRAMRGGALALASEDGDLLLDSIPMTAQAPVDPILGHV